MYFVSDQGNERHGMTYTMCEYIERVHTQKVLKFIEKL